MRIFNSVTKLVKKGNVKQKKLYQEKNNIDVLSYKDIDITTQDQYNEVMRFITSEFIINGEYELGKHTIVKINLGNFIILVKEKNDEGNMIVQQSKSLYKHNILEFKNILEEYSEESYIDLDKEVVVVKSICKDDFCKVINDYIVRQGMKKFDINEG